MKTVKELLDIAAEEARIGSTNSEGGPFGAVITDKEGNVISVGHNMVLESHDPTNHAEVVAIRRACEKLGTHDLSGCTIYSSCEPCPMCLSAIIWSNIKTLYYGASREDAARIGFRDSMIYDYLADKNYILIREQCKNEKCSHVMKDYEGEVY